MKIITFKDFMKKYNIKNDTKNELELQRTYNYPLYPRDSKMFCDKGLVNIDNGSQGGTLWTCFITKDNKSFYFANFGGTPDEFLLNQLPKPILYKNYKKQNTNSKFCGIFCLYFFNLIEILKYYDAILKMYFGYIILIVYA